MRPIKYKQRNIKLTVEKKPLPVDLKENLIKKGLVKIYQDQIIRNPNKIKELIEAWKKVIEKINYKRVNIDLFKEEIEYKVNLTRSLKEEKELYETEQKKIRDYLLEKKTNRY